MENGDDSERELSLSLLRGENVVSETVERVVPGDTLVSLSVPIGDVYALHAETSGGSASGEFAAGPAVAGDTVYAGREGEVGALAHSGGFALGGFAVGRERWSHDVSGTPLRGLAVADGAVVAATAGTEESESRTYVLDPA